MAITKGNTDLSISPTVMMQGRMAAKALGLGKPEGQGGISAGSVLGSGLLGSKGIVAGAALNLVKKTKGK